MALYFDGGKTNATLLQLQNKNDTQDGECWPEIQQVLLEEIDRFDFPENSKKLLKEIVDRSVSVRKASRPPAHYWFEVGGGGGRVLFKLA